MKRISGKDWEVINKKAGVDVLDIVINLDDRYTPGQQAELIARRCELTAQAQLDADRKEVKRAIDNILTEAVKEASNIRKLEYFFVDKLIALKQNI